ncbi:MAG TPA: type II toxin-antitoxin system HicB family antitoxin [Rhizomicrobium sp.]|jgi:predicted RNase H-like HicB family nuclease
MAHVYGVVHEHHGAFGISFPDFPGVASGGRSLDEAVERGTQTLAFHVQGMAEDEDDLPRLRVLDELRKDRTFRAESRGAVIVAIPVELPGKAVRVNVTIEEQLLQAIDRAAGRLGQSRSAFLASAARERIKTAA